MTEEAKTQTEAQAASQASTETSTTVEEQAGEQQQQTETTLLGGTETKTETTEQQTEQKTEETKSEGAPEKYEFVAPEGKEYDPNLLGSFGEAAKELNLSQEAAQKMLDKMAPAIAARQIEQVQNVQKEWREAAIADKEYGGEKLQENMGVAKKAYDQFSTPELRTLLEQTGLGNHPEVIRTFYRIGKAISEDTFVAGKRAAQPPSPEAVFFPTMVKK